MRRVKTFPEVMEIEAYVYTAGPVGTKWLENLKAGKLTAAYCPKCGRLFLPPKMFCPYDFEEVRELREIGQTGVVESYTVIERDLSGERLPERKVLAFIRFPGVEGGIIHYVKAEGLAIGMKVKPKWRSERRGSVTDIEYFEPA